MARLQTAPLYLVAATCHHQGHLQTPGQLAVCVATELRLVCVRLEPGLVISHSLVCWGAVVQLGVPAQVFMAPSMAEGDTCRKPATGMWDFMSSNCNDEIKPGTEQCKDSKMLAAHTSL